MYILIAAIVALLAYCCLWGVGVVLKATRRVNERMYKIYNIVVPIIFFILIILMGMGD